MSFDNFKAVEIYAEKTKLFPIEKQIFKQIPINASVLDLGCGTGRTTRHLADIGHHVIGMDISPMMITKARELHPDIAFYLGDATEIHSDNQVFDAVIFSFNGLDYLYPLSQRTEALNEIHRVLRNDGVFIYSSHDNDAIRLNWRTITRLRHHNGPYMKEKTVYGNLVTYYGTRETNIQQLTSAGFTDIHYHPLDGRTWRYYTCRRY